jgi:hypothetical protein
MDGAARCRFAMDGEPTPTRQLPQPTWGIYDSQALFSVNEGKSYRAALAFNPSRDIRHVTKGCEL